MKKTTLAVVLSLAFLLIKTFAASPDDEFQKIAHDYIDGYLAAYPEVATRIGDHRFDGKLRDYSAPARAKELARAKKFRDALRPFADGSKLTGTNQGDARILARNIDREIFELEELKEPDWNPLVYNESLADSLYLLAARDFDSPQKRIASLRQRMEAIPQVVEQAKQNLKHCPRIHLMTATNQVRGADQLVRLELDSLLDQAPELKKEIAPAQAKCARALDGYLKWLYQSLSHADGNDRLGKDKYSEKLRFAVGPDLSPDEIAKQAKEDLQKTQEALYQAALPLYRKYFPQDTKFAQADKKKLIKAALDRLAAQHPAEPTIVGELQKAVAEATSFVKSHDLMTVPEISRDIILMPEFRRGGSMVYCDSTGPAEAKSKIIFEIAPAPRDWPRLRQESFYREYNNSMLREVAAEQIIPGVCLERARACEFHGPTLVRAVFPDRPFIQGWGAYCGRMLAEAGYGGPETQIQELKMRLRIDCDAIIDQGAHCQNMTERDASSVLRDQGFQDFGEQTVDWKRVRLVPTQAAEDFAGMMEHLDLFEKARAKAGASFNLKKYNDQVTSYGSPPVKDVRELMGL